MLFWKEEFLDKIRRHWLRRIVKIQYYAGGKWFDAKIEEKTIEGNTMKIVSVTRDDDSNAITKIRLIDADGIVAGEISEIIQKTARQGVITLWKFPLYEVSDS